MTTSPHTVKCASCGQEYSASLPDVIDVTDNPELRSQVISGELFTSECPHCGRKKVSDHPLMYVDSSEKLIIVLSDKALNAEETQGYTTRRVKRAGELIEKVKIFSAGLDDVVMEMCKWVTAQELGKDVDLKFLRMEGADNEIILTYPSKEHMEMLSIGFNVYEDCRGIVQRNPAMSGIRPFACIDREWLSSFLA